MSFNQYLIINGIDLPLPTSYNLSFQNITNTQETEAGTKQRDVIRVGIVEIAVSFNVTAKWLKILSELSLEARLNVFYFDTLTASTKETQMYMENYSVELIKDTSYGSLWQVSFDLVEF